MVHANAAMTFDAIGHLMPGGLEQAADAYLAVAVGNSSLESRQPGYAAS